MPRPRFALPPGELVLAASGVAPAPIALRGPGAELFLARLPAGTAVALPAAPFVHLFLSAGAAIAADGDSTERDGSPGTTRLGPEDALRITGERPVRLTAERDTELLVLAMELDGALI